MIPEDHLHLILTSSWILASIGYLAATADLCYSDLRNRNILVPPMLCPFDCVKGHGTRGTIFVEVNHCSLVSQKSS